MTIEENLALAYLRSVRTRSPFGTVSKKDREYFRERLAALGLGLEDRLKARWAFRRTAPGATLLMATLVTPKLLFAGRAHRRAGPPPPQKRCWS